MAERQRRHDRRRRAGALVVLGTLAVLAGGMRAHAADEGAGRIEGIDLKDDGTSTKVILMLSRPLAFDVKVLGGDAAKKIVRRLVLDFPDTTLAPDAAKPIEVGNDRVRQIRPGQFNAKTARIVLDLASDTKHSVDAFESPPHVTIALGDTATAGTPPTAETETTPPVSGTAAPGTAAPGTVSATDSDAAQRAKTIPIRARWRKPYSLNYSR